MTLKTINNTVKIRTTAIVNGDMGFSFLSNPYTYTLAGRFLFPSYNKTRSASNRCLQNPYKKKARLPTAARFYCFLHKSRTYLERFARK